MRYHEQLNNARAIVFLAAVVIIAVAFVIDYIRP